MNQKFKSNKFFNLKEKNKYIQEVFVFIKNTRYVFLFMIMLLSFNLSVYGLLLDKNGEYQIETRDDLFEFSKIVNGTHEYIEQCSGANAVLMNDIYIIDPDENSEEYEILQDLIKNEKNCCEKKLEKLKSLEWIPIGNSVENSYKGTFNGQGHEINGIYCDISGGNHNAAGLFGFLADSAKIKNVKVSNEYVKTTDGKEANYAGGICGYNDGGKISECLCVIAKIILDNGNYGNYGGGICGYNIGMGRISMCVGKYIDIVSINGSGNNYSGVICGYNAGDIIKCFADKRKLLSQGGKYYNDCGYICGGNINSVIECGYLKDIEDKLSNKIYGLGGVKRDNDYQTKGYTEAEFKRILKTMVDDID